MTHTHNKLKLNNLLNGIHLPVVPEALRADLEKETTLEEISTAIDSIKMGKTPGPDGLPIEIYKNIKNTPQKPLLEKFRESFQNEVLPPSLRGALIILLPKAGKPKNKCENLRPISLLNANLKVLCKILARRLEGIIPKIIGKDQNGFIHGRQGFHNVRGVLNILHNQKRALDTALLDAKKAFDGVEWPYLFEVLECFGLGENFCNWITLLYTEPYAEILTNLNISKTIKINRGCRQGDPLSPSLFIMAIKPLAVAVRIHNRISGITIRQQLSGFICGRHYNLLQKHEKSIPSLLELSFRVISGYKMNTSKTLCTFILCY